MQGPPKDDEKGRPQSKNRESKGLTTEEMARFGTAGGVDPRPRMEVADIMRRELTRRGFEIEYVRKLVGFWWEFCRLVDPRIKKPAIYAAAMEYYFSSEEDGAPTQRDLARLYGVTPASISRVSGRIHGFCRRFLEFMDSRNRTDGHTDEWRYSPAFEVAKRKLRGRCENGQLRESDEPVASERWKKPTSRGKNLGPVVLEPETIKVFVELPQADEVWIGGRRASQGYILDPEPHRPDITIWVNEEAGLVVGADIFHPSADEEALLRALLRVMLEPMAGEPRRPKQVLLEDNALRVRYAPALQSLEIGVGQVDTRPVDEVMEVMEREIVGQPGETLEQGAYPPSYLEGGRLDESVIARFFRSAARLMRVAPWRVANDSQILDVALGKWNAERRCVSVLGAAGLDRGLLFLNSFEDYLHYSELAELAGLTGQMPKSIDVPVLSLNFDRAARLSPVCQKEMMQHGWEVESADAYPWLLKLDSNNNLMPVTAEDYEIASACADAVVAFVSRHEDLFVEDSNNSVTEVVTLPEWPENRVEVTAPCVR